MGSSGKRRPNRSVLSAAAVWLVFTGAALGACREDAVMLRGDWGTARFSVEIADDPQEQAQGLMHRTTLPLSAGMLFVYPSPRPASFWMRNTLIPLDMLFMDQHGVVTHIHPNAIPLDESPIFGGEDVLAILEINGGMAKRLGITVGSAVQHPAFAEHAPEWPC